MEESSSEKLELLPCGCVCSTLKDAEHKSILKIDYSACNGECVIHHILKANTLKCGCKVKLLETNKEKRTKLIEMDYSKCRTHQEFHQNKKCQMCDEASTVKHQRGNKTMFLCVVHHKHIEEIEHNNVGNT